MSKYNLGIVKTSLLANLNENDSLKSFIGVLKESSILRAVLAIYENIEKKHIPNEDLAIKYIDENIKVLKDGGFTKEIFEGETKKLLPLIEGVKFSSTGKKGLYENIHILLYESLTGKKSTNVNKLHDSFVYVLEHIKNNETKTIVETVEIPVIPKELILNDFLLKTAIFEFNEKYTKILSEDEINVLGAVINEKTHSKQTTFKMIKESTLNSLKELKTEITQDLKIDVQEQREISQFASKITESINNIQKLQYNESTFLTDVVDLINLKKELSN